MSDNDDGSIRLWARVFRPLGWWFLLVLVLYGIRLHQRLMERTRLHFTVTVAGQGFFAEPAAILDGQAVESGQQISLGWHQFKVTHPKGVPFQKSLFVWYGRQDLGRINLPRATGTLVVTARPAARSLTIRGPEFQQTLANTTGANITVPTDEYHITAEYPFSEERNSVVVSANQSATVTIAPRLGAVRLESTPAGATVRDEAGRLLGTTPVTVLQLKAGNWQFSLERDGYESLRPSLVIQPDQTNLFQTSLVNRYYAAALREAQGYFKNGRYAEAADAADEALKHQADDPVAMKLRREATGLSHLALARRNADEGNYLSAIAQLHDVTNYIADNAEISQLLADCTRREAERVAAEKQRQEAAQAEAQARAKIQELHQSFNVLVHGVENAGKFPEHELATTTHVGVAAAALEKAFTGGEPAFKIIRFEQPRSDIFALQARQTMLFSYRDCFLVGSQVRPGETRMVFKVLEYDHLPVLNLLGGLITATVTQTSQTEVQRNQYQEQIRQGAKLVEERIRQAVGK